MSPQDTTRRIASLTEAPAPARWWMRVLEALISVTDWLSQRMTSTGWTAP